MGVPLSEFQAFDPQADWPDTGDRIAYVTRHGEKGDAVVETLWFGIEPVIDAKVVRVEHVELVLRDVFNQGCRADGTITLFPGCGDTWTVLR